MTGTGPASLAASLLRGSSHASKPTEGGHAGLEFFGPADILITREGTYPTVFVAMLLIIGPASMTRARILAGIRVFLPYIHTYLRCRCSTYAFQPQKMDIPRYQVVTYLPSNSIYFFAS